MLLSVLSDFWEGCATNQSFQIFNRIFFFLRGGGVGGGGGWVCNQSIKTERYPRTIFLSFILYAKCVNSHFQLYGHTIKLSHYDTLTPLFCLHLLKSVSIRRPQNTFSQSKTPCMLLLLMSTPTHSFENGCCLDGVSSLGFLYFPPLPPFHAIQTHHI